MPDTIAPNPPSPFADADPAFRHLIAVFALLGAGPAPGVLAGTGCSRLAVVPDQPLEVSPDDALPDGLCPTCLTAMHHDSLAADTRPSTDCRTCDSSTQHDGVCALCRMEMHTGWVAAGRPDDVTLDQTVEQILADVSSEQPSAEDGPAAEPEKYPCQIGVFCDTCGTTAKRDIIVTDGMRSAERLEAARTHLRTNEGWMCTGEGDFCPACTAKAAASATAPGGDR